MPGFPALPRSQSALGAARAGGSISFGTAVPLSFDGSHSFGLSGWFRLPDRSVSGTLLGKKGEFILGVEEGRPYAWLSGQIGSVAAAQPLSGGWHFLGATYATTGAEAGELSLYIDGALVAQAILSRVGAPATANPLAVGGDIAVDVWCVCAYARALTPSDCACEWAPMQDAASTAASFCFMNPPAKDNGPGKYPIAFTGTAAEKVQTPGVSFAGAGYALPGSSDQIDPSTGSYTIQAWVYPELVGAGETQYVFAEGTADGANISLSLTGSADGRSVSLTAQRGTDSVSGGTLSAGAWQNVAVTFDGNTLTLLLGGVVCGVRPSANITLPSHQLVLGAAMTSTAPVLAGSFQGAIQSVDLWSRALSEAELATYAATIPEEAAVLGVYVLGSDSSNLVTSAAVGLYAGARPRELLLAPPTLDGPQQESQAPALDELSGEPSTSFRLTVDHEQLRSRTQSFLEDLRSSYRGPGAEEILTRVTGDLEAFHSRLAETGLMPEGAVMAKREGEELVIYRFTAIGAVEVHRMDVPTDACTAWRVELGVALFGGLLTIMSVPFPAGRLAVALRNWFTRFPNVGEAIGRTLEGELAMKKLTFALKIFYGAGGVGPMIWETFAKLRWWEFFFITAAIIIQLIEIIVPNPTSAAFYAMILAKIALVIFQVGVAMADKPVGC